MSLEQVRLKPEEIEINIPRLLKLCLKNVKWIVLIAMVVAIIFPSYKFLKDKERYNLELQSIEEITEEQSGTIKQAIDEYHIRKDNYDYYVNYEENSPIMEIDYKSVYRGELQFGIIAEQEIKEDVAVVLRNYLMSKHFYVLFSQEAEGKTQPFIKDLFENISADGGVVTVDVIASTKDECAMYTEIINGLLEEKSAAIQRVGTHDLILLQSQISSEYSYRVSELQSAILNNRKNSENDLKEYVATLSYVEKQFLVEEGEDEELIGYVKNPSPKFSIKFTIIGAVFGLILGMLLIVVFAVFSGSVQTSDEIEKRFGFSKIQDFNKKEIRKQVEASVTKIKKTILRDEEQMIGIVSTTHKSLLFGVEELIANLEKENIKCVVLEDITVDEDKIEKIEEGIPVILFEAIGKSKVRELYEEVSLCEKKNVKVLGYICVEE